MVSKVIFINLNFSFLRRISLLNQVATQLSSRSWGNPVPDPILPEYVQGSDDQTRPLGDDDVVSVYSPFHQPSVVVEICSSYDAQNQNKIVVQSVTSANRLFDGGAIRNTSTNHQCYTEHRLREGQSALQYAGSGKGKIHPPLLR